MQVITSIEKMQDYANNLRHEGKTIGFVPTMGAIHEGHLALIKQARKESDVLVVSIFINPIQFGEGEDYERYPRNFERDKQLLEEEGVDIIFYPAVEKMYKKSYLTYVNVEKLSEYLCGKYRKNHFRGVATVICKLFNIVKPHKAYFGEKDYQQSLIIKKLVEDLNYDIKIEVLPTVRNQEGLAFSSRNLYLTEAESKKATIIYKALNKAKAMLNSNLKDVKLIKAELIPLIQQEGLTVQYLEICDPETLEPLEKVEDKALIAIAAYLGNTRLIDNIVWKAS
jgi:pantoate--beta-alanine ligase